MALKGQLGQSQEEVYEENDKDEDELQVRGLLRNDDVVAVLLEQ